MSIFRSTLKVLYFSILIVHGSGVAQAADVPACRAFDGDQAVTQVLRDWNELPPVLDTPISHQLAQAIDQHPITKKLRAMHGEGNDLTFRLADPFGRGGWTIQHAFLTKLVQYVFPHAVIDPNRKAWVGIGIGLNDSIMFERPDRKDFDMSDLKVLNHGPALPSKEDLRKSLGLPVVGKIISMYVGNGSNLSPQKALSEIFSSGFAQIVVISFQGRRFQPSADGVSVFYDAEWSRRALSERPTRAIILNETQQRLPYLHRAADYAVVLGHGNIFEPIHANRQTYFQRDVSPSAGVPEMNWEKLVNVAIRSGAGHSYTDLEHLLRILPKDPPEGSNGPSAIDQHRALTRILRALNHVMERYVQSRTWDDGD